MASRSNRKSRSGRSDSAARSSKSHEPSASPGEESESTGGRLFAMSSPWFWFIVMVAIAAGGISAIAWLGGAGGSTATDRPVARDSAPRTTSRSNSQPSATDASRSQGEVATATESGRFEKLAGRWVRPDGGYVLKIKSVGADGQLEATYLNPSPIRVSAAKASDEAGKLNVFVELNDVNYPGCTYKLLYDAASDQLKGEYFQAQVGETYQVEFVRD